MELEKKRMAAAFRKLFCMKFQKIRTPESRGNDGAGGANETGIGGTNSKTESPARRGLLRHGLHRDQVQPVEGPTNSPNRPKKFGGFLKLKKSNLLGDPSSNNIKAFPSSAHQQKVRAKRLMKELRDAKKLEQSNPQDPPFTVELVNDNLFEWHVSLYKIDEESELAADMKDFSVNCILFHVIFPENFPFAPPFIRVISPKIDKGFVMEGGAICMELLTPMGWASAYTMEAVITQLAASLVKGQGRISRKTKNGKDFSQRTAEESFRSLVKTHDKYGWVTPPLADG